MKLKQAYTVIYIKDKNTNKFLFLYRNKKKNDINHGKYIGVGGKIEPGESKDECIVREVYEETNLKLKSFYYMGEVRYIDLDADAYEKMYVYYSDDYTGNIKGCSEGSLKFMSEDEFYRSPHWEGDKIFLDYALKNKAFKSVDYYYLNGINFKTILMNREV